MLTAEGVSELICLTCPQHEEADTRILCMQHIQSVIKAVQELSSKQLTLTLPSWVYTIASECPVWKNYGFRNLSLLRIQIYQHQCFFHDTRLQTCCHPSTRGPKVDITSVVLAAYTITGCDTVSYPFCIGKKRTLKCALENRDVLETITKYGEPDGCLQPMQDVLQSVRRFYFALYGRHDYSGTLLCTGTFHYQERRSSFIAVHRGCIHASPSESITSAGDIQTSHSTWPIAPKCSGIWMISPRWLPTRKKNNKTSKTLNWKTYCKCKNGKCGDKCPCHCAGPECNIGCLCSGDPLKYNRFTIEWRAFLCLNVSHRLV